MGCCLFVCLFEPLCACVNLDISVVFVEKAHATSICIYLILLLKKKIIIVKNILIIIKYLLKFIFRIF